MLCYVRSLNQNVHRNKGRRGKTAESSKQILGEGAEKRNGEGREREIERKSVMEVINFKSVIVQ